MKILILSLLVLIHTQAMASAYKFHYGDQVKLINCDSSQQFYPICPLSGWIVDVEQTDTKSCDYWLYKIEFTLSDSKVITEYYCSDQLVKVKVGK